VVLVDTRRLADCFGAIDFFESRNLPYIVALNPFDGVLTHSMDDVREALAIPGDVPMTVADARDRQQVKASLIRLVEFAMVKAGATVGAGG
jgi:hypothetical protein